MQPWITILATVLLRCAAADYTTVTGQEVVVEVHAKDAFGNSLGGSISLVTRITDVTLSPSDVTWEAEVQESAQAAAELRVT